MVMDGETMKRFFKKLIVPALLILAIVCIVPLASAEDYPFTYDVRADGVAIVSCNSSYSGAIDIPDTIEGKNVIAIENSAFYGAEGVTSVKLPSTLKSIGVSAFEGCTSITKLVIPNSVVTVGESAFASCASLEKLEIGTGITSISESMFEGCTKLNNVNLPDSVNSIGAYAFSCCDSLETLVIYPYVTSIGNYAFYDCESLTKIALPETITVIGEGTFAECNKLASVSFTDSITKIDALAFDGCEAIETVYYTNAQISWLKIDIDEDGNDYINDTFLSGKIEFKHSHNYTTTETISKPTCENKGFGNFVCECGYAHKSEIPALGHSSEPIAEVSATCTKAGTTAGEKCSRCGVMLVQPQTIPATGHAKVTDAAVEATCTSEGKTEGSHCKVCGEVFTAQEVIAKKPHNNTQVLEKATLTTNGKKVLTCQDCGNVETKILYNVSQISLNTYTYSYTGKAITPAVTVKDSNGTALVKGTDYTLTYADGRTAAGKYTVTVKLIGDYSGSKKLTFSVITLSKTSSLTASSTTSGTLKVTWAKVANATGYRVFVYKVGTSTRKLVAKVNGTSYTLKNAYNGSALKVGTTYRVAVIAYAEDSTTGVLAHAPAGVNKEFKLTAGKPTLKASSASGKVTLTWTNVKQETGYQVYYSTSKNGTYSKLATTKTDVVKYTKALTKGKTYYFKVRAYTKVGNGYVYGNYSSVVSCKIK